VRDEHLAEEAVQETLLAALESLDSFDGGRRLRTWLTGILLHKIHDGFGAARAMAMPATGRAPEPVEWLTPDHSLHVKRLCSAFAEAVGALPERQAQAFVLGEIAGVETERLCRKLGVTRGTCGSAAPRAHGAARGARGTRLLLQTFLNRSASKRAASRGSCARQHRATLPREDQRQSFCSVSARIASIAA
jgi:RNA polymerase sigma-70 factor (ECF subfamily)